MSKDKRGIFIFIKWNDPSVFAMAFMPEDFLPKR